MLDIVPALAEALGQLRRGPGNDSAWVDRALQAFERDRSDEYDCLRRRLGFAGRLVGLAGLTDEERATITVGLFFVALVGDSPSCDPRKPPRAWMEYLLRNEDWLAPPLHIAQLLCLSEPSDSMAAAIAGTTVTFDTETLVHHSRPLQVLQSLRDEARTPDEERVAQLLWTEAGQEHCDRHVRHRGQGYTLESSEIRDSIMLLKPTAPRAVPEPMEAPLRLSGTAGRVAGSRDRATTDTEPEMAAATSENFERRKRALRSASRLPNAPRDRATQPRDSDPQEQPDGSTTGDAAGAPNAVADLWLPSTARSTPAAAPEPSSPRPTPKEDDMETRKYPPSNPKAPDNVLEKLEELRVQLQQIAQVAAEGQALLASLAPQLEQSSAWMAELEEMVNRWKGQTGADLRAA